MNLTLISMFNTYALSATTQYVMHDYQYTSFNTIKNIKPLCKTLLYSIHTRYTNLVAVTTEATPECVDQEISMNGQCSHQIRKLVTCRTATSFVLFSLRTRLDLNT